ncbi:MAG: NTPase [Desulfurococcales archaeon]|nr:NTPase [Desulfurococcales archaeon]
MRPCAARRIFYTGNPGTGKSTIVKRIVDVLADSDCRIGGIFAPEVRSGTGTRIGFKIVDAATGRSGWLAKKGYPGQRIGRYGVVRRDVVEIGVEALKRALVEADVIVVDEIGPMELVVEELREAIISVLKSDKSLVGVVHRKLRVRDPTVYSLVAANSTIIEVTPENRDRLLKEVHAVAESLCCKLSDKGRESPDIRSRPG